MYNVSEKFKQAMKASVQSFKIRGLIDGIAFDESNILAGSFSITNQCSDNTNVQIGQVYTGELNVTLILPALKRYTLHKAEIQLNFGMKLSDGTYEYVPLGVYYINEANWTQSGVVIKAYDAVSLLDSRFNVSTSSGYLYDFYSMIETNTLAKCGTTEEEFSTFANADQLLGLYVDNDVETWRDFLSWVAQTCACNAYAGRDGKIYLKPYNKEPVDTIDNKHRFAGGSFSDFVTKYSGVSYVDTATQSTKYFGVDNDDKYLTYNLGSNPFLQYGTSDMKEQRCRNVLNALQAIEYVPFTVTMLGNPAYDLMDVMVFSDGIADGDKLYCITKYTLNYNGAYKVEGVGKNPALSNAKSKVDKNIAGLLSQTDSTKMKFSNYRNATAYSIGDGKSAEVITTRLASTTGGTVMFFAEIHAKTTATTCTVKYKLNNSEIKSWYPIQTCPDGRQIISLYYPLALEPNQTNTFVVEITSDGGIIDIDEEGIRATWFGLGIAETSEWDGILEIKDKVDAIEIQNNGVDIVAFTDSVIAEIITPNRNVIKLDVPLVEIDADIDIAVFKDIVYINKHILTGMTWQDVQDIGTWKDVYDGYIW